MYPKKNSGLEIEDKVKTFAIRSNKVFRKRAIRAPKKYEPPSPRKIVALGKLYLRNTVIIKIIHNIKKAKSSFSLK